MADDVVRRRPESQADRQRELAALRVRLHEEAAAVRTPEDWARSLRLAARFPGQSFANVLLIAAQRPDATMLRGYGAWRAMGRQVGSQEPGTVVFSTTRRTRSPNWRDAERVAHLWDLSQTTGTSVVAQPATPPSPTHGSPELWDALCWMARRVGFAVEREYGCPDDGTTMWAVRRIRILPESDPPQAIWALAHQLGHILLHEPVGRPPGTTTSGCTGVRKTEADSIAFIICTRYAIATALEFPSPATWAGRDPRAQPPAVILTIGERITATAAQIVHHLDRHVPGPQAEISALEGTEHARLLADAQVFFTSQLAASWAPAYLNTRGLSDTAIGEWRIGYAPANWTALTDHLRNLGHPDDAIRAAGLAHVSSRGTLIDHFRDRVMLPVLDAHGTLAGFIGRAHPESGPHVPKYLNSLETATYRKGELLFGLHQARVHLTRGAIPVIAEGPFDAIAISLADPGRHVGLAPCGTAMTERQAATLAAVADLPRTGILAAFDNDNAGRKAATRAYAILRPLTGKLGSVQLVGKDPAEILQRDGSIALRATLQEQVRPLSSVIIDARIATWDRRLDDTGASLLAMRDAATLIARLLPPETAEQIRQITNDRDQHGRRPAPPSRQSRTPRDRLPPPSRRSLPDHASRRTTRLRRLRSPCRSRQRHHPQP